MPISIEADPTLAQGYIKVNGTTAATITTAGIISGGIPAGAVMPFARATAPAGWLIANGNAVPNGSGTVQGVTADFAALHAAVSTSFGTAGTLPDLQGIFVRGSGSQAIDGITYNKTFALKETDGLKRHSHDFGTAAEIRHTVTGGPEYIRTGWERGAIGLTGGDETRPANIALLYCIKF